MATVYSRTWKSGKVSWYTKVKDARGQWKPLLLREVKNGPQAKKLASEIAKELERSSHGLSTTAPFQGTFAELCALIYESHFQHEGSAQSDGSRLKTHAGDVQAGTATWLGAMQARKVKSSDLARYFAELAQSETVRGKPYAATTINRIRANFSTVFEKATELGHWLGPNPVVETSARAELRASFDILQADEVGPTLDACDGYWRGCLAVGIFAALRKGEIFALEKRDVDLPRRTLMVRRSHGRQTTKGGHHDAVPIHEDLVPYLEGWLKTPGPLLFPNHDGQRRSQHTDLPRILQMALVRAGFVERWEYACRRRGCGHHEERPAVPSQTQAEKVDCPECGFRLWGTPRARNIRWHEGTRHTLASLALMSGASLQGVQAILRHKDPRLTIKTYGHLSAGFLADEVNRVSLPGLTRAGNGLPREATEAQIVEPYPPPAHTAIGSHGAPVVRVPTTGASEGEAELTNRHEKGSGSEWSRRGLNSRPMHCERIGIVSAVAASGGRPSQVAVFTGTPEDADSTPLPPVGSRTPGRGAPMVRRKRATHHETETAKAFGSGRTEPALLTVRQVARHLSMSVGWVYRRIEKGDLEGVRPSPDAPLMVTREALADYLRRFPGLDPPVGPPVPVEAPAAPARARKGAA